jgi:DNA-binding response OmpR family regulator
MRLLVIEDERDLAQTVRQAFEEQHFAVDVSSDGEDGLNRLLHTPYDAAVVDLMLPRRDGWSVVAAARNRGVKTPVLILTARGAVSDRIRGLNLGADDYLAKPFALAELVARINAIVRRSYGSPSTQVIIGDITIDTAGRCVYRSGVPVELTARQFAILELLIRRRGRMTSRDQIRDHIYDDENSAFSNVVDVHIASLRRKLGTHFIETRRNEGYIISA